LRYGGLMTKPHTRPRDPAQLAKLIIDIASGEVEAASVGTLVNLSPQIPYKWPAA
jgi:hypothetical protein